MINKELTKAEIETLAKRGNVFIMYDKSIGWHRVTAEQLLEILPEKKVDVYA